ncbi:hypothetical protein PFICI_06818 [Pestalotiopsis fici W106-1]|uniref:DUF7702 domain-containing protein n=1 Tax=Pestalotiopsis fici (strain W106-1 / CGMCC3.15140) TaxID=1229662 RepID=W3X9H9_PESFW|nr:uncharacterized protein PFICI_06818 [Pestalotiopsis fici W106-1]ETS81816.1 hypothetical protein PFICI_06818 [Pestalotiopsis fici W106-1]
MPLDGRAYVSIAELVIYLPLTLAAVSVCKRHGFERSSGWIYIIMLGIIRVIGAVCNLVTYSSPSVGLYTAVFTLDSIGISPMLFATLGLISRLFRWTQALSNTRARSKQFRLAQLVFTAGFILSIVGGVTTQNTTDPSTISRVAILLYLLGFIVCAGFEATAWTNLSHHQSIPAAERNIVFIVAAALPLILIRIIFSLLVVFVHDSTFSIVRGPTGVYVGMAVVEEVLVMVMYTIAGWRVGPLDEAMSTTALLVQH